MTVSVTGPEELGYKTGRTRTVNTLKDMDERLRVSRNLPGTFREPSGNLPGTLLLSPAGWWICGEVAGVVGVADVSFGTRLAAHLLESGYGAVPAQRLHPAKHGAVGTATLWLRQVRLMTW